MYWEEEFLSLLVSTMIWDVRMMGGYTPVDMTLQNPVGSKNIEMLLGRYMLFRHKERMAEIKIGTI